MSEQRNDQVKALLSKTRQRLRRRKHAYLQYFSDNQEHYRAVAESLLADTDADADTDALVERLRGGLSSLIR